MRKILLLAPLWVVLQGCSSLGVQPWEREVLARDDMQLDASALDTAFDDHIYFSK